MAIFFVSFGVTVGVFAGSLTLGKRKLLSVGLPALTALLTAILMYVGELLLLNGHLYIFGSGFFFESLPLIVLSPADLLVVLASGGITTLIFALLNGKKAKAE